VGRVEVGALMGEVIEDILDVLDYAAGIRNLVFSLKESS